MRVLPPCLGHVFRGQESLRSCPPARRFAPLPLQTLLSSPLRLLEQLPCGPAAAPPQQLRRSVSMQALCGSNPHSLAAGGRRGSHGSMLRPPSLPAVQEHSVGPSQLPQLWQLSQPPQQQQQQVEPAPSRPPRRSQSDGALVELQRRTWARERCQEPLWLAQLLHQPRPPEGVGVCSAATLQDLACRQLCASLVAAPPGGAGAGGGGQRLTPGVVAALQAELRSVCRASLGRACKKTASAG